MARKYEGVYARRNAQGKITSYEYRFRHNGRRYAEGGYATAVIAHAARMAAYGDLAEGRTASLASLAKRYTVKTWTEKEWLPSIELQVLAGNLQDSYLASIEGMLANYVYPHLGDLRLSQINEDVVREWMTMLLSKGRVRTRTDGAKGLAPASVRGAYNALNLSLDYAVRQNILGRNPMHGVKRPSKSRPVINPYTEEQVRTLYRSVEDDLPMLALFALLFTSGMRRGEICGLRWDAVNLELGHLQVRRQRTTSGRHGEGVEDVVDKEVAKTKSSHRRIELDPAVVEILTTLRAEQRRWFIEADRVWSESVNVFVSRKSLDAYHPYSLRTFLQRAAIKAGLPALRFHDGRHTAASLLLERDVSIKIVQELLGHSSAAVTSDIYTHTKPTMHKEAVSHLGALLRKTASKADELAERRKRKSG